MARVSVDEARRLFNEDAKIAVFRASAGQTHDRERERSVNVYPRKTCPGYVYCIWKFGMAEHGLSAIEGGGMSDGNLHDAALEATRALLDHYNTAHPLPHQGE